MCIRDRLWGEPDPRPGDSAARQVAINLAGDVALQDPDDVALGATFLHPSLEVGAGVGIVGDPDHHDAPERAVGLAVATLMEAMVIGDLAGVRRYRCDAAHAGPGRFGMESLGVVAGSHQ